MSKITVNTEIELSDIFQEVEDSDLVAEVVDRIDGLSDHNVSRLQEAIDESSTDDEEPSDLNEIRTTDRIEWKASNLMDIQVMEALAEAYTTLTPSQIIERLKV